jgi:hypothetical protein
LDHSFDQMLGCFKRIHPDLAGVDPKKPGVNRADGTEFKQVGTTERQMLVDPRHEVNHVLAQMADPNGGFVADFAKARPTSITRNTPSTASASVSRPCWFPPGWTRASTPRRSTTRACWRI